MGPAEVLAAVWWPALFAGGVAIAVTVAIERLGGIVGGLLGTLPTTIVPAALGMWAVDPDRFTDAMGAVPVGMLLNALFLWVWRVLPPRLPEIGLHGRLSLMVGVSLSAWFAGALAVVAGLTASRQAGVSTLAIGMVATGLIAFIGVAATWTPFPAPKGHNPVGPATLLLRGALAAAAIGTAVWLSAVSGPLAGGLASVFPAIFLTTLVALWLAQGEAVPSGAVGPMMLGSASVAAFALLAAVLFPVLGSAPGATVAWVCAILTTTIPAYGFVQSRRMRA